MHTAAVCVCVQVNYANMLVQGLGVPMDLHAAMEWYKKAAQQYPEEVTALIAHLQDRIDNGGASSDSTAAGGLVDDVATVDAPVSPFGAERRTAEFRVQLDVASPDSVVTAEAPSSVPLDASGSGGGGGSGSAASAASGSSRT